MGKWEDAVKAECIEPDPIKKVPEDECIVDDNKGIANYLRLSLTIDRNKLSDEHFGEEEAVVLMKNPSTGTGNESDKTLGNLVKYMPSEFGIINCVNITPVVTSDKERLNNPVNQRRMLNKYIQELNLSKIKSLLDNETHPTLILATGRLGDDDPNKLREFFSKFDYRAGDLVPDNEVNYKKILEWLYDNIYDELSKSLSTFDPYIINKSADVARETGSHPGYRNLSEQPESTEHSPYIKDGFYDLHKLS